MTLTELFSSNKERLRIGVKQTSKAIIEGLAVQVYIARDADQHVTRHVVELAEEQDVEIIYVENMKDLGKACNIDVGAATAVITK